MRALARAVGTSRPVFARIFREAVGASPLRHLAALRMREAARLLLLEDPGSIAAVAAAVGYASEFAFGRAFKRHTGTPPGSHRRLARGGSSATGALRGWASLRSAA